MRPAADAANDESAPAALASAADQSPDLLLAGEGPDLRLTAANAAVRALAGAGSVLGLPLQSAVGTVFGAAWLEACREVLRSGERVAGLRTSIPGPGGASRIADFTLSPWHDAGGAVRGVVAAGRDVTALVRAHEETEERFQEARDVVAMLQHELLPGALPLLPGLRVAAGYLQAGAGGSAGGDWFDTVPLLDGRVALVVGDVVGHGIAAAVTMSHLRTVLHERLGSGVSLEDALTTLDAYARVLPAARAATVCVAVLDPVGGGLRYASAGHPAPMVVGADGVARFLDGGRGGPLATGSDVAVGEDRVEPDEMLVLYSDGLVERPGRTLGDGRTALAGVALDGRGASAGAGLGAADRMCGFMLEMLARDSSGADDVSLVVAHRTPLPPVLQTRIPAHPSHLRELRGALDGWMNELGIGDADRFFLQHGVGELAANAVEHAYHDAPPDVLGEVRVGAALMADGAALITVSDDGRWRPSRERPRGGRGLAMTAGLTDGVEIERTANGTVATVRLHLTRPVALHTHAGDRAPGEPVPRPFALGEHDEADDHAALTVTGPVDVVTAPRLHERLLALSHGGTRPMSVDLSAVTLLSSAGVQVLHDIAGRAAVHRVALHLLAPVGSPARDVLVLVDLAHLLGGSAA